MFGKIALDYLISNYKFKTILDIGSGEGEHSKILRASGKEVTELDLGGSYYSKQRKDTNFISSDYLSTEFNKPFEAIWACHVLEHQLNPNLFLKKINKDLKEAGVLAITVPPLKDYIVGGHITLWNAGILLYQLILAGFNCREASIRKYGYNISVILNKKKVVLPTLSYDYGDVEKLLDYFPKELRVKEGNGRFKLEGFDGNITILNWKK